MYIKEPSEKAQAVVIWLHGLGSDYRDMEALSLALTNPEPLRHVYLQAPARAVTINGGMVMPAWYDILDVTLTDREDMDGIAESYASVEKAIESQLNEGFTSEQIYLAGFSQGAAIVLFTGMSYAKRLGGVMALSGYIPKPDAIECHQVQTLPIFLGVGRYDDVVLPQWSQMSFQFLKNHGYNEAILKEYDMAHAICSDEVRDVSNWLSDRIQINIQRVLMSSEGL